jgi:hypothetical protein
MLNAKQDGSYGQNLAVGDAVTKILSGRDRGDGAAFRAIKAKLDELLLVGEAMAERGDHVGLSLIAAEMDVLLTCFCKGTFAECQRRAEAFSFDLQRMAGHGHQRHAEYQQALPRATRSAAQRHGMPGTAHDRINPAPCLACPPDG